MPPIQLECPVGGCGLGEDGGGYKTPLLPSGEALQLLTLHTQFNHGQPHGGAVGQQQQGDNGARVGCKAEKVPRPVLKKGQSEDKFLHFSRQWVRYKRASNLGDEQQIRDQKKDFVPHLIKSATVVEILATSPEAKLVRSLSKWRRLWCNTRCQVAREWRLKLSRRCWTQGASL